MVWFTTGSLHHRARRGFTLIEIMIVGALLALFAGIALFAAREMYESNRRKAMFDETRQIGIALSLAHDDIGFFPRIYLLEMPTGRINYGDNKTKIIRPAFDTYGYYLSVGPQASSIIDKWRGPYMPFSSAKLNLTAGSKGLIRMRLSDVAFQQFKPTGTNDEDPSLVVWPTDTWGNPYIFYEVHSDASLMTNSTGTNPQGVRLIRYPGESGDFFTAVVSYGPNRVPGGLRDELRRPNSAIAVNVETLLKTDGLYVKGDLAGGKADYTLKSYNSMYPDAQISSDFTQRLPRILQSGDPNAPGILDTGSDDIFWRF